MLFIKGDPKDQTNLLIARAKGGNNSIAAPAAVGSVLSHDSSQSASQPATIVPIRKLCTNTAPPVFLLLWIYSQPPVRVWAARDQTSSDSKLILRLICARIGFLKCQAL
jgi:hypothetical protein